jgi:hypothetical protein
VTPADLVALPSSPLAREAIEMLNSTTGTPIADHCVRTYLFARLLASDRGTLAGRDYDDDLLFCARRCVCACPRWPHGAAYQRVKILSKPATAARPH